MAIYSLIYRLFYSVGSGHFKVCHQDNNILPMNLDGDQRASLVVTFLFYSFSSYFDLFSAQSVIYIYLKKWLMGTFPSPY